MFHKSWGWLVLGLIVTGSVLGGLTPAAASAGPYAVAPVLPTDNAPHTGFFQLKVQPAARRTLPLKITNLSAHTATYIVTPHMAATNSNGTIDDTLDNHSAQLPVQTAQLFHPSQSQHVTVGPHTTKRVTVDLTMPSRRFTGILMATLAVHQVEKGAPHRTQRPHVTIATAFAIGVVVYNHLPSNPLDSVLRFQHVGYQAANGHPALALTIDNRTPNIVGQGRLTATLTDQLGHSVHRFRQGQLLFAPRNQFALTLNLNRQELSAGHYTLAGQLTTQGGVRHPFRLPVTITRQAVAAVHHQLPPTPRAPLNGWVLGIIGLLVLTTGGLAGLTLHLWRGQRAVAIPRRE